MYSLKIFLFILSFCFCVASSNEIYARSQLRGLHQIHLNKLLDEEIQRIVERVIVSAQANQIYYKHSYFTEHSNNPKHGLDTGSQILNKFSDEIILTRLQSILIDSDIILTGPKCCNPGCDIKNVYNSICKFIEIVW